MDAQSGPTQRILIRAQGMGGELRIEPMTGGAVERYIPELARLRIEVFRDFPYLYDGDLEYESRYLKTYVDSPASVVVLVFDEDQVVGASTALPMAHECDEFKRPFAAHGYDPRDIFYFGESVLRRAYRGRGLGVRFFEERERHARAVGDFGFATFCAVQRPPDHPRRPPDYRPLDQFWRKRGFECHPELVTEYAWKDLDEDDETPKAMVFWLKALRATPARAANR